MPVGSRVLVLLGEAGRRGHLIRALLVHSGSEPGYAWPGAPPNPAWASAITVADTARLLSGIDE